MAGIQSIGMWRWKTGGWSNFPENPANRDVEWRAPMYMKRILARSNVGNSLDCGSCRRNPLVAILNHDESYQYVIKDGEFVEVDTARSSMGRSRKPLNLLW